MKKFKETGLGERRKRNNRPVSATAEQNANNCELLISS